MTQGARLVLLVCTVLAVTGTGRMAKAQAAAALVLETHGEIHPGLAPYHEVPVATQITLAGNAKLVFITATPAGPPHGHALSLIRVE